MSERTADVSTVIAGGGHPFVGEAVRIALPAGWVTEERVAAGTATSYRADSLPEDGRFALHEDASAEYRTRILIRRPAEPSRFSGTVVVEWMNVSGGVDSSPLFSLTAAEIIRKGHAWVGVSAQYVGVEGGHVAVTVAAPGADAIVGKGLVSVDPDRYGSLRHPGDAFAFDIYTQVARALRAGDGLGGLRPTQLLGAGQSQSAAMLVTYANGVQPFARQFDGFLIHSRGGGAAPLGAAGAGMLVAEAFAGATVRVRDDLDVPVLVMLTETDVVVLGSLRARQDDTDLFRLWEVAGTAHADRTVLGFAADILDCGGPVNDGQQQFVARAALRALSGWAAGGAAPAKADRLTIDLTTSAAQRDGDGIILGGIRTPLVDTPVVTLSGQPRPGSSLICMLSGATDPIPAARLVERYTTRSAYLEQYARAADRAIEQGFVLAEDRDELLACAAPELVPG